MTDTTHHNSDAFLEQTTETIRRVFDQLVAELGDAEKAKVAALSECVKPGKMLRSRLALSLAPAHATTHPDIIRACAATELIHTATLFHDDVIDGASLRRGQPTLWEKVGATGAILLGDLFFSTAIELLLESDNLAAVRSFVGKVREVCATEAAHELVLRGKAVDVETSLRIARGKTGALFAFAAESAADPQNSEQLKAFEEAGYLIGTAYQVADDLIDEAGDEQVVGKTLGTDRKRRKYTLMQAPDATEKGVLTQVHALCQQAVDHVRPWPSQANGLKNYIEQYLAAPKNLHFAKVS